MENRFKCTDCYGNINEIIISTCDNEICIGNTIDSENDVYISKEDAIALRDSLIELIKTL